MILVFRVNNAIYEIKKAKNVFIYRKDKKYVFITILLDFF